MNWPITIGYLVFTVMVWLQLHGIFIALIGGIFGRLSGNLMVSAFIASIFVWICISFIWFNIFDYWLPFIAYVLAFAFLMLNTAFEHEKLTDSSIMMGNAQIWAIIGVGIFILGFKEFNWY